jgi:hypothetical protein
MCGMGSVRVGARGEDAAEGRQDQDLEEEKRRWVKLRARSAP